jgi:putative SOS response-associated peptidase YedK
VCGRYVLKTTRRELAQWFGVDVAELPEFGPSYNVAPQTFQPIVRLHRDTGLREVALLRWGLIPYWSKDSRIGYSTINARAETITTAPAFRDAIQRRRCLVPADAFYEWQKLSAKTKQPFAIALRSRKPYAFAGVWESWREPKTQERLETFTIITVEANEVVKPMHDRMPVIVEPRDYERWLADADPARLPIDLLKPYPGEAMTAWRVDPRVGNVKNDDAGLMDEHIDENRLLFGNTEPREL